MGSNYGSPLRGTTIERPSRYRVNELGQIETLQGFSEAHGYNNNPINRGALEASKNKASSWDNQSKNFPFTTIEQASNEVNKVQQNRLQNLENQYKEQLSMDRMYTSLSDQIAALSGRSQTNPATPQQYNEALSAISAPRAFGSSDLATKLNFQVSDQQIVDDYNNTKLGKLNSIIDRGNAQIAGIQERLNAAQTLLSQLPEGDPRRTSSNVYVNQLKSDLSSVQSAVSDATNQVNDFKPVTVGSPEASREITSFREFLQLPEERATQQLRQIDPESYRTAVGLGRQYRQMATQPLGQTTTEQTEQLRNTIEQEALNQLRLGSTIGAEERRGYEQAIRGAQTARGNIFGLGPAVQEAAQIGAAGEQRKLARYGAAQQFLGSGETTGAAAARDLALRDALTQQRLGAAASFIGGGPSLYNLSQARTGAQQAAFQNYVQANQALPGQFGQAPSTAQPFYQAVDQGIPTNLTSTFANLYGSMADYQARTYGAYTAAQASRPTFAQQFGAIASGISGLVPSFSFSK
jgi:hypothetical protein